MGKLVNKPPKTRRKGISQKPGTGYSRAPPPKVKGGSKK